MSVEIYFHCGTQKTGSTFLQEHVFPNITNGSFNLPRARVGMPGWLDQLAKAEPPIVCSREGFSGLYLASENKKESQVRILNYISQRWTNAGLILFFREPSEFLASYYKQYLQKGGTLGFMEFIDEENGLKEALYYDEWIDAIYRMKWKKIIFFDYRQLVDDQKFVVRSLEDFIGCKFHGWSESKSDRSNVSIGRSGARFVRWANKIAPHEARMNPDALPYLSQALRFIKFSPRQLVQNGLLKFLNKFGPQLIPEERLEEIKSHYAPSWNRTRLLIKESQNN